MWHLARVLAFGGVLAVVAALSAPSEVIAQKKNKGKVDNGYAALPEDYKAIQNKKDLTGQIIAVSGSVVTLRVDSPKVEPNPKYKPPTGTNSAEYRLYQDGLRLQRDYQSAMNTKNPVSRQQAMIRYQNDMARLNAQVMAKAAKSANTDNSKNTTDPFILVHYYKEFDLETQEKVA